MNKNIFDNGRMASSNSECLLGGIITAAVVTSGEKHDGKQLQELVVKSEQSGIEVKDIIGDCL